MIVQNLYHANLKIDSEGSVTLESAWQLARADAKTELNALLNEARAWAGKIGDPFRIPAANGTFTESKSILVSEIECRPIDLTSCKVVFTGTELVMAEAGDSGSGGKTISVPSASGAVSETRDSDGVCRRTRSFRARTTTSTDLIPQPGRILDWEGGAFVCESCSVTTSDLAIEFKVVARETSLAQLGLATSGIDDDGFETRNAVWFVGTGGIDDFTAAHPVGGAENWAGENFLLVEFDSKPVGKIGYQVTLKTRKVETRLLSQIRTEEFAGVTSSGGIRRKITWTGRWRVAAAELANFHLLTGTAPNGWGEATCIITKITPARLSDLEYEVVAEAQYIGNPGLYVTYSTDDRSDLARRTDVSVDTAEFHITAEMAGYTQLPNGQFLPIPCWNSLRSCPFETDTPLSEMVIEKTVRSLVITVGVYLSGGAAKQITSLDNWAASRYFSGDVAGISGSYLKISQHCREIYDDSGVLYTQITRSYQKAPSGLTWSSNYWNNN